MQPLNQPRGDRHFNYMVNFEISLCAWAETLKRCRVLKIWHQILPVSAAICEVTQLLTRAQRKREGVEKRSASL